MKQRFVMDLNFLEVAGIGPSLRGASDALADSMLELHDGNGNILATNDNWKGASDGSSQQAEN